MNQFWIFSLFDFANVAFSKSLLVLYAYHCKYIFAGSEGRVKGVSILSNDHGFPGGAIEQIYK